MFVQGMYVYMYVYLHKQKVKYEDRNNVNNFVLIYNIYQYSVKTFILLGSVTTPL